jgi:hypothetical protein
MPSGTDSEPGLANFTKKLVERTNTELESLSEAQRQGGKLRERYGLSDSEWEQWSLSTKGSNQERADVLHVPHGDVSKGEVKGSHAYYWNRYAQGHEHTISAWTNDTNPFGVSDHVEHDGYHTDDSKRTPSWELSRRYTYANAQDVIQVHVHGAREKVGVDQDYFTMTFVDGKFSRASSGPPGGKQQEINLEQAVQSGCLTAESLEKLGHPDSILDSVATFAQGIRNVENPLPSLVFKQQ